MKTLIVYYSFTQNNEKLAKYLQKKMNCDITRIETVRNRTGFSILFDLMFSRKPDLKPMPYYLRDYDRVIFIAPIWGGKIATPMKSYLIQERANIKQYSFITVCGGSAGQKEKIEKELASTLDSVPDKVVELWINNLLPTEKKDTIKHTSGYRIEPNELSKFDLELRYFLRDEKFVRSQLN
jgi:flavodoxin